MGSNRNGDAGDLTDDIQLVRIPLYAKQQEQNLIYLLQIERILRNNGYVGQAHERQRQKLAACA